MLIAGILIFVRSLGRAFMASSGRDQGWWSCNAQDRSSQQSYLVPNVDSTKVEKFCCRASDVLFCYMLCVEIQFYFYSYHQWIKVVLLENFVGVHKKNNSIGVYRHKVGTLVSLRLYINKMSLKVEAAPQTTQIQWYPLSPTLLLKKNFGSICRDG